MLHSWLSQQIWYNVPCEIEPPACSWLKVPIVTVIVSHWHWHGNLVCLIHDIDIVYVIRTHLVSGAHDVHWENALKWYTASCSPDEPDSFINLLFILLCRLACFYACNFQTCLPISANVHWEWFMILPVFARFTYVNVQHSIVGPYYYYLLVNEGIYPVLVMQTFNIHQLLVYYIIRMSTQPLILYDPLLFLFLYIY